jgi:ADP-ribosylglycohydrolase
MKNSALFSKIYGCLLGGIIGDAMGAPGEGKTYEEIERTVGWVSDFTGAGTDDTIIKHILCEAIITNDGYVTADEFSAAFANHRDKFRYFYTPVRNQVCLVDARLVLPVYAGMGGQQSSSSAMAIAPMGLINACNPRQAALETYDVAGLIHGLLATACRDGACAIAAAVAEAMSPDATVDTILDASTRYLHPTSSAEMIGCIQTALALAQREGEYNSFRRAFYAAHLYDASPTVIADSRETVPCTLALFYLAEGNPRQAIVYAANFGRDADTIAGMAGGICGAFKGVEALGSDWVAKVTAAVPGQEELALKLMDVTMSKARRAQAAHALLDRIAQ